MCNDPLDPPLCDCNGGGLNLQLFRTPDAGHVGDTITYTVVLSNPQTNNQCPITDITATITLPNGSTVTLAAPTTLNAGASSGSLTATYTIAGNVAGNTLAATAQATGVLQDCFCGSPTSAQSQVCIFVARPDFTLTKTVAPTLSKAGDSVQYSFTICNTGNIALTRVSILDDVLGNLTASFPASLLPGQCATVSLPFVVPAGATSPLVNTVTATYADVLADAHSSVTRTASTTLELFTPSVQVVKSGPAFSKVGDTVTYSFTVTNTSSANTPDLVLDSISDTLLGSLTAVAASQGCTSLAPNGMCTFTKTHTVGTNDPNPMLNTVTVHYHPQGFPNDVTASDSHSVTLVNPSFFLSKTCQSGTVSAGGTAVFRVTVTNDGNVPLNFTTTESAPFSLAVGATNSFTVSQTVPPVTPNNCATQASNTISVTASLPASFGLDNTITKTATAVCPVVAFGRTRGFWGNQGHSILDPDNNGTLNTPVTLGGNGRTISVTTVAQSDTLLAGNFCPTPASCTLSQNLQRGTMNTLVAQTLALQYNILFITCYAGQTIAQLSCTANLTSDLTALGLSGTSTVQQVLSVANALIGSSAAGGTTTQQQAGAMNSLLGCLNRES